MASATVTSSPNSTTQSLFPNNSSTVDASSPFFANSIPRTISELTKTQESSLFSQSSSLESSSTSNAENAENHTPSPSVPDQQSDAMQLINTTAAWGTKPINHDQPWSSQDEEDRESHNPMVWVGRPNNGTEVWEKTTGIKLKYGEDRKQMQSNVPMNQSMPQAGVPNWMREDNNIDMFSNNPPPHRAPYQMNAANRSPWESNQQDKHWNYAAQDKPSDNGNFWSQAPPNDASSGWGAPQNQWMNNRAPMRMDNGRDQGWNGRNFAPGAMPRYNEPRQKSFNNPRFAPNMPNNRFPPNNNPQHNSWSMQNGPRHMANGPYSPQAQQNSSFGLWDQGANTNGDLWDSGNVSDNYNNVAPNSAGLQSQRSVDSQWSDWSSNTGNGNRGNEMKKDFGPNDDGTGIWNARSSRPSGATGNWTAKGANSNGFAQADNQWRGMNGEKSHHRSGDTRSPTTSDPQQAQIVIARELYELVEERILSPSMLNQPVGPNETYILHEIISERRKMQAFVTHRDQLAANTDPDQMHVLAVMNDQIETQKKKIMELTQKN